MSLPSGYRKLEYIQSSGTQKIDTGLLVEKSDSFEMEFEWTPTAPSSGIYVGADGYMQVGIGTSGYGLFLTSNTTAYGTRDKVRVVFANVTETLYVNNAQVFSHNWSNENLTNVKLGLFSCGAAGNTWRSGAVTAKLYGCTIKKAGVLVRNFIPCKNSSGVIGLWDDVNSTFYQNAGSGTFTAGPEIKGANKALIDGTGYDVKAGKCLVGGTAYAIKKGRMLKDGTGYDISLVSYDPVFLNNEWSTIIDACQSGNVPETWAVGDHKDMTINGASYQIDIIGKNHDTYTSGGTAPLTFQMHDCYATSYPMNTDNMILTGWTGCTMRSTSLPAVLSLMPTEVKDSIREVNKLTASLENGNPIVSTADKLFLLSEIEIFGSITYSKVGEGTQYDYYKAGNSKEKKQSGSAIYWWERSPYTGDWFPSFCLVVNGGVYYGQQGVSFGAAFGFCF